MGESMVHTVKTFNSGTAQCVGDLYLPQDIECPPIIVMAHGFAAERSFRLPAFAEKFCSQGVAVFLFDYRTFGDSEGTPRQWVHPTRQLQDWRAAISLVRSMSQVDGNKLALWGTSFSGGHVVNIAAEDHAVTAIIAQVPFVSGWNLLKIQSLKDLTRLTGAAIIDSVRALFGAAPYEYPIVGREGEKGIMNTPESYEGYLKLVSEHTSWRNALPARVGLYIPWYSPLRNAGKVQCPALIIAATNDSLIPVTAVKDMADKISNSIYVEIETDHFQPYIEPYFSENIGIQQQFIADNFLI